MRKKNKIQIILFVFIGIITLGIGYAAISSINLVINSNTNATASQNSYKVIFKTASVTSGTGTATIDSNDSTVAYFDVSGLSVEGDTAVATYTIKNESSGVGASISLNITNEDTEYFQVTETVEDTELQAGDTTTATITVQMIKTLFEDNISSLITGTLITTPMENASATSSQSATAIPSLDPYKYSINVNSIGQELVGELPSFEAAKSTFGHPMAIAHIVSNGVITESYVAFEKNNQVYYLRGGVGESWGSSNSPIYDENKNILKTAYGENWSDYCSETVSGKLHYFSCSDGDLEETVYVDGETFVTNKSSSTTCYIHNYGGSDCE